MKISVNLFLVFLFLFSISSNAQSDRDIIKVGVNYVYLSNDDALKPGAYLEFTRVFYRPITIGVGTSYTRAKDLVTITEDQDLRTFSFDLNGYYAFLDTEDNELQLGLGLSARLFNRKWLERDTQNSGTENFLRPGLNILLNYNHFFNSFLVGFRGNVQTYSNNGTVYIIGGHVGVRF